MARMRTLIKPKRKPKIVKDVNRALLEFEKLTNPPVKVQDWKYEPFKANVKHGHPRFYELTALEEDLHSRKNEDYTGGGPPMGNFERVSAFLAQYPNFPVATPHGTAIVYMMKQLDAALWLIANNKKGNIEGVGERFGDIGVYAKIIRILYEESQK